MTLSAGDTLVGAARHPQRRPLSTVLRIASDDAYAAAGVDHALAAVEALVAEGIAISTASAIIRSSGGSADSLGSSIWSAARPGSTAVAVAPPTVPRPPAGPRAWPTLTRACVSDIEVSFPDELVKAGDASCRLSFRAPDL